MTKLKQKGIFFKLVVTRTFPVTVKKVIDKNHGYSKNSRFREEDERQMTKGLGGPKEASNV